MYNFILNIATGRSTRPGKSSVKEVTFHTDRYDFSEA